MLDKDFVRLLYLITDILTITKRYSNFLQSENLDLAAESNMYLVVWRELQENCEAGNAFETRVYARRCLGLKPSLELDILQIVYYLRKGD